MFRISAWSGERKRTLIGLDVGAGGVRAVQLVRERKSNRYRLCDGGSVVAVREGGPAEPEDPPAGPPDRGPRPHEMPNRPAPIPDPASIPVLRNPDQKGARGKEAAAPGQELTFSLAPCMRQGAFRGRSVATALNPPAIEYHTLDIPPAVFADPKAVPSQVVRWEMLRLMNEPADAPQQMETRYWALPGSQTSTSTAIGVAAGRSVVQRRLKACQEAGLHCVCVDAGAAALARFGALLKAWSSQEVWGVLDLGYHESRLIVCVDQVPVLVRRGGAGGEAWTKRVADALQISLKAAEVHKRDHGIAGGTDPKRDRKGAAGAPEPNHPTPISSSPSVPVLGNPDPKWARDPGAACATDDSVASLLLGALRTDLKELAAEIKRSYEYVLSCHPKRHAADLVLVGGSAAMRRLPEFLAGALGIRVRVASDYLNEPSCRLTGWPLSLDAGSGGLGRFESFAMAIGLAVTQEWPFWSA